MDFLSFCLQFLGIMFMTAAVIYIWLMIITDNFALAKERKAFKLKHHYHTPGDNVIRYNGMTLESVCMRCKKVIFWDCRSDKWYLEEDYDKTN